MFFFFAIISLLYPPDLLFVVKGLGSTMFSDFGPPSITPELKPALFQIHLSSLFDDFRTRKFKVLRLKTLHWVPENSVLNHFNAH